MWYILYVYGTIQPICTESAVKHQANKQTLGLSWFHPLIYLFYYCDVLLIICRWRHIESDFLSVFLLCFYLRTNKLYNWPNKISGWSLPLQNSSELLCPWLCSSCSFFAVEEKNCIKIICIWFFLCKFFCGFVHKKRSSCGLMVKVLDFYPKNPSVSPTGTHMSYWWQEGHLAKIAPCTKDTNFTPGVNKPSWWRTTGH